jgi:hypothetical protein
MNGSEGLTGYCKSCGTSLDRAVIREVRHYEDTHLLEVTCARCERQFLAISVQTHLEAVQSEDVAAAAEQLAAARSLADLFPPGDLPDAA